MRGGSPPRRVGGTLAICGLAFCGAARAGNCSELQLEAGVGQVYSRWEEFDSRQQSLLHEQGWLTASALGATAHCLDVEWQFGAQHAQGWRDYSGVTSTGAAVQTSSKIAQTEIRLQALATVTERWSLGARLAYQQIDRELQGVGLAQGYPEHYRYWRVAVGTRYALLEGSDWQLLGNAWLGGGPPGSMTLRLPGRDPATLELGQTRHASLGLDWQSRRPQADAPGWSWRVGLNYALEQIEAGPPKLIRRNGVAVGAALQPKTRQSGAGLLAAARYDF